MSSARLSVTQRHCEFSAIDEIGRVLIHYSALVGFLLSLTPLSCEIMGWRGASATGASGIGVYLAFGGILMTLGSIGEV